MILRGRGRHYIGNSVGFFFGSVLGAGLVGYALSVAIDSLLVKRLIKDRVPAMALSSVLALVAVLTLSAFGNADGGPVTLSRVPIMAYMIGLSLAFWLRLRRYTSELTNKPDWEPTPGGTSPDELEGNGGSYWPTDYGDDTWGDLEKPRSYFVRHWSGHLSLPISYWVNGALLSAVFTGLTFALMAFLETSGASLQVISATSLFVIVGSYSLALWAGIGIWRSAGYHVRRGGLDFWGKLARIAVVLGFLGAAGQAPNMLRQGAAHAQLAFGYDPFGGPAEITISKDGESLLVRGTLTSGTADKFRNILVAMPGAKTVVLTSNGGRLLEANQMAELIRQRRLNTRVDDVCLSACTTVLLAGLERTAPNRARIGFHQPSFPGLSMDEQQAVTAAWQSDYEKAGVDAAFVAKAMATTSDSMWYPTVAELINAKVLTEPEITVRGDGSSARSTSSGLPKDSSLGEIRLSRELEETARQINLTTPKRVDEITILDRMTASGYTLTYNYTVDFSDEVDLGLAKTAMALQIAQNTCKDGEMAAAVGDGVKFVHSYKNTLGKRLFDIPIARCP